MRFWENRGILLKGTTRKISCQERGLLNFLRLLMMSPLPLKKNLLTPLTKSFLVLLGLTTAASVTDASIQNKIYGSKTTLVFSSEEIHDIIKIYKSLKDIGLLMKGIRKTVESELKEDLVISRDVDHCIRC